MIRVSLTLALAAMSSPALAGSAAPGAITTATAPVTILGAAASPIVVDGRIRVDSAMPRVMPAANRAAYRSIFTAIRDGRFAEAASVLDTMPSAGLLTATARAELWLASGGPKPSAEALSAWLTANSDFPQAERLAAIAHEMGLADVPAPPQVLGLLPVNTASREKPRPNRADTEASAFIAEVRPLLAADKPDEAEAILQGASLSSDIRTEWQQRIAWTYYLAGDDGRALSLATQAAGGSGEWAAMGSWVAGLASFRSGDCSRAASHFAHVASAAHSDDLAAAGQFWTARAETACGWPQRVSARLRSAARYDNSFYGLLARRMLGIDPPPPPRRPDFLLADWRHVDDLPGARRAAALAEIGELGLADRELRYLAMTGLARNHVALTYLAAKLNLPATQYWLSHNAPPGVVPPVATRYPAPEWVPSRGWRVDRSLVYAHALQESRFVTDAKSRTGARGIMQLMPGTARQVAASMALPAADDRLTDPAFNIECGQTYLEELRDSPWTGGLLPKVIAAYNAGPGSVKRWNEQLRDNSDPLLFIESIPFEETRHYVEVVLRNYWMYQQGEGASSSSLDALAQGMWPRFPGLPGRTAIRIDSARPFASAD